MIRVGVVIAVLALAQAPMQCTHEADPNVRQEDTAGDALWDLAHDFKTRGDDAAYRHTLETLVARYPSSRHAAAAKEELGPEAGAR